MRKPILIKLIYRSCKKDCDLAITPPFKHMLIFSRFWEGFWDVFYLFWEGFWEGVGDIFGRFLRLFWDMLIQFLDIFLEVNTSCERPMKNDKTYQEPTKHQVFVFGGCSGLVRGLFGDLEVCLGIVWVPFGELFSEHKKYIKKIHMNGIKLDQIYAQSPFLMLEMAPNG